MNNKKLTGKNLIWIAVFVLVLAAQVGMLFYYGNRKSGFHEDEFYSFYSTNRTAGLFVPDREWVQAENYRNEFVVLPGEGFQYGLVATVQSWDVHPPFYYDILHTVCSLFPGVFSKWLGIIPNILAFILNFVLMAWLTRLLTHNKEQETQSRLLTLLVCTIWGFGAAVISGVMFIRMYEWLTFFILLCAFLHVRAVQKQDFRIRSLFIPLFITVYLGFLTQYYYIIFHFFLGAVFCFYLLGTKRIKELLGYVLTCAISLGLALVTYPAALSHIFRGYRGTEAVDEFSNMSNTGERLGFFYGLVNDYVFAGTLNWWLLLVLVLGVTASYARSRTKKYEKMVFPQISYVLLFLTVMGYFVTISKTALLLGETSNRYQLPVYGLLILLLVLAITGFTNQIAEYMPVLQNKKLSCAGVLVLFALLLGMDFYALKTDRVFFLYEEEAANLVYVREHKDTPVVILYNEATPHNVWRLTDELLEYPQVYMAGLQDSSVITDEGIKGGEQLIVYVADYEDNLNRACQMLEGYEPLEEAKLVANKGLWTVYEVDKMPR